MSRTPAGLGRLIPGRVSLGRVDIGRVGPGRVGRRRPAGEGDGGGRGGRAMMCR